MQPDAKKTTTTLLGKEIVQRDPCHKNRVLIYR